MDSTTFIQKLKSTAHELADSKKAVTTIVVICAILFTMVGGFVFARLAAKYGLDPKLADKIPEYSLYASIAMVTAAVNYVHGQAKVDVEKAKAEVKTVSLKDELQSLGREALSDMVKPDAPPSTPPAS